MNRNSGPVTLGGDMVWMTLFILPWLCFGEAPNCVVVDTFSSADAGRFPSGWKPYKKEGRKLYIVRTSEGDAYLHADVPPVPIQIGKKMKLDPKDWPYLSWRWRVVVPPEGGDERYKEKNDSGAAIYVVFNRGWPKFRRHVIKYVWSSADLPKGEVLKGHYDPNMYVVVLRNARSPLNRWFSEKVNVFQDYKRIFRKAPPEIIGVALMTDADDTNSRAVADYDDIVFWKE